MASTRLLRGGEQLFMSGLVRFYSPKPKNAIIGSILWSKSDSGPGGSANQ